MPGKAQFRHTVGMPVIRAKEPAFAGSFARHITPLYGADDENRTRTASLGSWGSATKLHPHNRRIKTPDPYLANTTIAQILNAVNLFSIIHTYPAPLRTGLEGLTPDPDIVSIPDPIMK